MPRPHLALYLSLVVPSMAGLAACSGGSLEDARHPTGSSTLAADSAYNRVAVANTWEGSVSLVDRRTGVETTQVGGEPTRIARVEDRFVVTLRTDGALAEIDASSGSLLRTLPTSGPEPYGIVATEAGDRVYVSISQGDLVEERDGSSLELLRTFPVGHDPRWMALHPSGRSLVVGHATGQDLTAIDLETGESRPLSLPQHTTTVFLDSGETRVDLAGRVTGDPAFSADGSTLAVPALYVDNVSGEQGTGGVPSFPYYKAAQTTDMGRFNSTIALYRVRGGQPRSEAFSTLLVSDFSDGPFAGAILRSYLTSVTPSPDGLAWLATMEASDAVMLVDATVDGTEPANESGLAFPSVAVVNTGRGPRGLAVMDEGEILTHTFLQHGVQDIEYEQVREEARFEIRSNSPAVQAFPVLASTLESGIVASALTEDQLAGAKMFYSAADTTMGAAGVSCSSCHFEGRTDGLTWKLMNGDRQTPSLAGEVSATAPVTWTNDVPTVAEEAQFTATFRMGSQLPNHHANKIEAFVDFVRLPILPEITDAEAIARGKALFEREDVACASCHSGEAFTDNQHHTMFGLDAVNTPSLVGIAATAPYLHDGSARDLRQVLELSRGGAMGDTGSLSDAEMDDLVTYLRSL